MAAFSELDLRRFCLDTPRFRFICEHFGELFSHGRLVDTLLRQGLRHQLTPDLLDWIERINPRQYERFSDKLLVCCCGASFEVASQAGSEAQSLLRPYPIALLVTLRGGR